ncbi:anomalous homeobox protein isoform X1 [Chamaea fasciata]|uniref:anomalous homeobox protein isoform X1 n=1 Tax=Chamaea fasciata TaxID=190680 RepID=UPI00336A3C4D
MMMQFMAMLKKNENEHHPPTKLLNLAGQLCQELQIPSPGLEELVETMMGCKNKTYFLTNIHIVRACVSVHIHKGQHDAACSVLEYCEAEEKEELVQLWHEIHYRKVMEKQQVNFLTPLQKFRCRRRYCTVGKLRFIFFFGAIFKWRGWFYTSRCLVFLGILTICGNVRKFPRMGLIPLGSFLIPFSPVYRNPPPVSLCPEGLKNRNYSEEVRQHLHRFAAEVTANPNKKQREGLARDMNLQPVQVYNWFANYRRRQKARLHQKEQLSNSRPERALASHTNEPQRKGSHTSQTADGSHVGICPEQVEVTPTPCEPGWEQSAAPLYKPPEGSFLKMLESSCLQSPELYEAGTSKALFTTHSTEQPAPLGTEAVMEPGTCSGSPVLLQGGVALGSNESLPSVNCCLPLWQASDSTGGGSGSMWTPGVEVPLRLCVTSLSAHLFLHPVWKKAKPWDKGRSSRIQLLTQQSVTCSRQHSCSVNFLLVDGGDLPADTLHESALPQEMFHCFLFLPCSFFFFLMEEESDRG